LYNGILFGANLHRPAIDYPGHRLVDWSLPNDNALPLIFADRLHDGGDIHELTAGWKSSDRPPLETGEFLLVAPLGRGSPSAWDRLYVVSTSVLQLGWIVSLYALCHRLRFSRRQRLAVLALTILSGFVLVNSVFSWPKMLGASFVLTAMVLWPPGGSAVSRASVAGATAAATFGMLSHGTVAFTLIPLVAIGAYRVVRTRDHVLRFIVVVAAVAGMLYGPWIVYQRVIAPPGDRLIKWEFAGVETLDSRSALTTLSDQYRAHPVGTIASYKVQNLETTLGLRRPWDQGSVFSPRWFRTAEFYLLPAALAFSNLGWVVAAMVLLGKSFREHRRSFELIAICAVSIILWCLLLYGPATTVNHVNSYATILLLMAALASFVGLLRTKIVLAVVAAAGVYFAWTWMFTLPGHLGYGRWGVLLLAGGAVLTVAAMTVDYRNEVRGDHPEAVTEHPSRPVPVRLTPG
jgi:hypothetical protein